MFVSFRARRYTLVKGSINFNNDTAPVCLPNANSTYDPDELCTLSGFGQINATDKTSSTLLWAVKVPIIPSRDCKKESIRGRLVKNGMICAGGLDGTGGFRGQCKGDSGGPLTCNDPEDDDEAVLFGLVSWGSCGDKPGVLVDVKYYLQWIHDNLE